MPDATLANLPALLRSLSTTLADVRACPGLAGFDPALSVEVGAAAEALEATIGAIGAHQLIRLDNALIERTADALYRARCEEQPAPEYRGPFAERESRLRQSWRIQARQLLANVERREALEAEIG